ncbi:MAG: dephospho-CoA kinase [Leptothrix sp. (in: Bacteria)]|nr:dephospho-CoA kinase [Leptothrix sp. (in: b-proteobacteria)]
MDRLGLSRAGRPVVRTLGLTGGIGSGKSTVAQRLVACGAHLVDTDAIARALTQAGGAAMPALADAFGPAALTVDGALNREHMRQLAFTDAAAKARLEGLLHPLIGDEARRQAAEAAGQPVVFDVPLLTESAHWRARVDRVLVVDCSEATQAERVCTRPGWSHDAARRVVAQQAGRAARRAIADAVIFNDGISVQVLDAEVRALWQHWFAPD